jgi:hypothetical protein
MHQWVFRRACYLRSLEDTRVLVLFHCLSTNQINLLQVFALLFGINCTKINHSHSSNIFMCIINRVTLRNSFSNLAGRYWFQNKTFLQAIRKTKIPVVNHVKVILKTTSTNSAVMMLFIFPLFRYMTKYCYN